MASQHGVGSSASSSKTVVYAALVGNTLVAITKFIAAAISGSSSMLSEGIHSLVDTFNQVLLLHGLKQAARPPDASHPLGYGRELYFWSFVVAVLLFSVGAGVSIYEGILRVINPKPIEGTTISYIVLGLSCLFEGGSWVVALRNFRKAKGDVGYWEAVRKSKDPPTFMVLFEDTAALIGICIAGLGIYATEALQRPVFDGIASILIGLVLGLVATLLARESKSLLIGERATAELTASIARLAGEQAGVGAANVIFTVHQGPEQVVVALSLEFNDALHTSQIEASVAALEKRVREFHPEVVALFVKPQTRGSFERDRRALQPSQAG